ncbi:MAG: hypothetical protein IIA59_03420 [Candidatus Marinimicrobia bacterium]|nr:hypothetical protein [Candidatus Neomarinimicrobiota bacterium]
MKRSITLSLMAALLAVSCSESADPFDTVEDFDPAGQLAIQTSATSYDWTDSDFSKSPQVTASIANISSASYYAFLGDGLVRGLEQATLFVAEGSDGYLEFRSGDGEWNSLERVMLFNGVAAIILRPGKQYELLAFLSGPDQPTGTFRFKINYSTQQGGTGGQTFTDYSNTFVIK